MSSKHALHDDKDSTFEPNKLTKDDNNFIVNRICELPPLKQQFILMLLRLANAKYPNEKHKEYAFALCELLSNIVNYQQNKVLHVMNDALQSVLITYFYDQHNLANGQLNGTEYQVKHENLLRINQKVKACVERGYCSEEFVEALYYIL